jgi:hypothetical protein
MHVVLLPVIEHAINKIKNGLIWDLTDKHRYLSLRLEAICRHPLSKIPSVPRYLNPNVINIYPGLYAKIITQSRNRHVSPSGCAVKA